MRTSRTGLADYLPPATHLLFVEPAALEEEFSAFARMPQPQIVPADVAEVLRAGLSQAV